jgi:hypothetical protein
MGGLFIIILHGFKKILEPLDAHLVIRAVLGGLGFGLAGALLPITLFPGETQTQELITNGAEACVLVLLTLALVKVVLTSLCLSTGWKGGYLERRLYLSRNVRGSGIGNGSAQSISINPSGSCGLGNHGRCNGGSHEGPPLLSSICHAHISKRRGSCNCYRHSFQFYVYHVFFHIAKA